MKINGKYWKNSFLVPCQVSEQAIARSVITCANVYQRLIPNMILINIWPKAVKKNRFINKNSLI